MQKLMLLLVLIFCFSCHSKKQITTKNDSDNPQQKWQLSWEENFDSKEINPDFWTKIPRGKSDWNNFMSSYDSLYEVKNGNLLLRGIKNNVLKNDSATYLTGGIYTKNKKIFGFGKMEIKAKLNAATGAWPAFWMLPENNKWPHGGEIDIMERLNNDTFAYQTVHSNYTVNLGMKDYPKQSGKANINPNEYNIFSVEKYKDSLVFYINGKKNFTYPKIKTNQDGQFPFADADFYLLLDMQLGGSWVGKIDEKTLPVEMYVDWVKFYELK